MKKFLRDFKAFALQGNVLNLAVGVIIGAAFQSIVTSFTTNIISPIIGIFVGQNFDGLKVNILGATLTYGAFITAVINFLITALVVFLLVRLFNRITHADTSAKNRDCPYCQTSVPAKASRCPACTTVLDPVIEGAPKPPC